MFATRAATWKRLIVPFSNNTYVVVVIPYFQLNCRVIITYKLARRRVSMSL